ncbi:hypothetical protein P7C73_g6409, partial [Tremellales sp. Uapishka_1]
MMFSDALVFAWSMTRPRGQRVFHNLSMIILTTASIAYFSMASNLGNTPVAVEYSYMGFAVGTSRQVWYVRYIDWVITTPALLLELLLASGLPLSDIITLVFFDLVMIITGLVGSLIVSRYKWGFFAFGNAALVYIWWVLFGPARSSAGAIGHGFQKSFVMSAGVLSFLWLLYPIAWGLADGGNVISPDSEMIFYGILDVIAKPVFIFFHLFSLSKLDLTYLQLSSGKFSNGEGALNNGYDHERQADRSPRTIAHETNPNNTYLAEKKASTTTGRFNMGRKNKNNDITGNGTTTAAARTSDATAISTGPHGTNVVPESSP